MIIIKTTDYQAEIDPLGAWLVSFRDYDSRDILFPRQTISYTDGSIKQRGGSHVCLPNFGPDSEFGLAQHGFGRTLLWEVESAATDQVTLQLRGGSQQYSGLLSRLTYELTATGLVMRLQLRNEGKQPLAVAPGFHPYFQTDKDDTAVKVDDKEFLFVDLAEMQLASADKRAFRLCGKEIVLMSTLKQWAHWTDRFGDYVCIEPTMAGNAFLDATYKLLQPGHTKRCTFRIDIK